jgi:hypothetical protein
MHAVHDAERWAQVRVPGLLQLVGLSTKPTFCKQGYIIQYSSNPPECLEAKYFTDCPIYQRSCKVLGDFLEDSYNLRDMTTRFFAVR